MEKKYYIAVCRESSDGNRTIDSYVSGITYASIVFGELHSAISFDTLEDVKFAMNYCNERSKTLDPDCEYTFAACQLSVNFVGVFAGIEAKNG